MKVSQLSPKTLSDNINEFADILNQRSINWYDETFDTYIELNKNELPKSFIDQYTNMIKDYITYYLSEDHLIIISYDKDDPYNRKNTAFKLYDGSFEEFIDNVYGADLLLTLHKHYKKLAIEEMKRKIKLYEEMED